MWNCRGFVVGSGGGRGWIPVAGQNQLIVKLNPLDILQVIHNGLAIQARSRDSQPAIRAELHDIVGPHTLVDHQRICSCTAIDLVVSLRRVNLVVARQTADHVVQGCPGNPVGRLCTFQSAGRHQDEWFQNLDGSRKRLRRTTCHVRPPRRQIGSLMDAERPPEVFPQKLIPSAGAVSFVAGEQKTAGEMTPESTCCGLASCCVRTVARSSHQTQGEACSNHEPSSE